MEFEINNIKLNGVKNVRDLGNIPVKQGKIKKYKILRGSCLENLTYDDMCILVDDYKLSTIIDLRTYREIEESPDVKIDGIKYIHRPIFDKRALGITHESDDEIETQNSRRLDVSKMYEQMLTGESLQRISEIIKTIINLKNEEYSVLIHCTEGKDRTGIIIALILMILGADKEVIINDYLYTNKVNKKRANKHYLKTRLLKFDKEKAENVKNILLARPEYIKSVFDIIEEDWYGIDNFIKYGLKLENFEIEDFKDKVLK